MTTFNKTEFQHDIVQNIGRIINSEESINNGQLLNFLTYFEYRTGTNISVDTLLSDEGFVRSLRMLIVYNTLALSLNKAEVYAAAVEVFPLTEVPPQHATLLLALLDHIQTNPMQIQTTLEQALSDPLPQRMSLLRQSLLRRLGDHL